MIRTLLSGKVDTYQLISLLVSIPVILIALTVHECFHGYAAYKLGDPTARNLGRLSLNPMKHLDLLGTLSMLFFGFGWAKPVPIYSRHFKKPKRDMALTALAGPVANFLLAFIGLILFKLLYGTAYTAGATFTSRLVDTLILFFYTFFRLNLCLGVFNLIPIPPLDGSRIFYTFLPEKLYFNIMKYEQIIQVILLVALFTGFLDGPLNFVINNIGNAMISIIELVPGL